MSKLLNEISLVFRQLENLLPSILGRFPFPPEPLTVLANHTDFSPKHQFSLKDLIGDGFLFAVPTFRRTLEVRKTRKIGIPYRNDPKEGLKILTKKPFIKVCNTCGNYHERDCLCPHCYAKVREETKEIREKIMKELKLDPIDKEVVVLYDGEKTQESSEFWNGKRIIEMEKQRPQWFSRNLMQRSTQPNAETKEVEVSSTIIGKPSNIG